MCCLKNIIMIIYSSISANINACQIISQTNRILFSHYKSGARSSLLEILRLYIPSNHYKPPHALLALHRGANDKLPGLLDRRDNSGECHLFLCGRFTQMKVDATEDKRADQI